MTIGTATHTGVSPGRFWLAMPGRTVPMVNASTGKLNHARIFVGVGVLYTHAEATWMQALSDWIGAHVRFFTFFGSVPPH